MPSVLVLLGAGASAGYAPSTGDLTTFLLGWKDFGEPSRSYRWPMMGTAPNPLWMANEPGRTPLFKAIYERVAATLKYPNEEFLNFERLIHVAELLGQHLPAKHQRIQDRFASMLAPFIDADPAASHYNEAGQHFLTAVIKAGHAILNEVARKCDAATPSSSQSFVRGLEALARLASLKIGSLNYDDRPFLSPIDFYTGFDSHTGDDHEQFLLSYPWPADRHFLFQLHGSILFSEREGVIVRYRDRRRAAKARRDSEQYISALHADGAEINLAPMITGFRKPDKVLYPPYATYGHVFREEAFRCDRWLIIGYGGSDEHVNVVLAQARRGWMDRTGKPPRIAVIDFVNPTSLGRLASLIAGKGLVPRAVEVFGIGRRIPVEGAEKEKLHDIGGGMAASFAGTDWALGDGLDQITAHLQL